MFIELDDNESVFLIPLGKKYAKFRFKPSMIIKALLDEYNIPYEEFKDKGRPVKIVSAKNQKATWYNIPKKTEGKHMFLFTSDIIDKVLDYYKVEYKKGSGCNE